MSIQTVDKQTLLNSATTLCEGTDNTEYVRGIAELLVDADVLNRGSLYSPTDQDAYTDHITFMLVNGTRRAHLKEALDTLTEFAQRGLNDFAVGVAYNDYAQEEYNEAETGIEDAIKTIQEALLLTEQK